MYCLILSSYNFIITHVGQSHVHVFIHNLFVCADTNVVHETSAGMIKIILDLYF